MTYLRANWPQLLFTLLGSVFSTAFALGFSWAVLGIRVANAEGRLDEIEKIPVAQTHWQVQQNIAAITDLNTGARRTDAELSQINIRLGVIDAKLDVIAEALKHRP